MTHTRFMREQTTQTKKILFILGVTGVVYLCFQYLLPIVAPFLIAFYTVVLINPIVVAIKKKIKIGKGILSSIILFLLLAFILGFVVFLVKTLLDQLRGIIGNITQYQMILQNFWRKCCGGMESITGIDSRTIQVAVEAKIPLLGDYVQQQFVPVLMENSVLYIKKGFYLISIVIVTLVSAVLIGKDYEKIKKGIKQTTWGEKCILIGKHLSQAAGAYLKAQTLIMILISVICIVSFWAFGSEFPLFVGLGIGLCDAMPFLGTGTILVPWLVIKLINGEFFMAAMFATLYVGCSLIREFLEPKLMGAQLGVPPIVIIISIYTGICLFGIPGVILGPIGYMLIWEIVKIS